MTVIETTTVFLPIDLIDPGDNDRKVFDEDQLWALAQSINLIGLTQAITVRPLPNGRYRIVAGERRYRAHLLLGRTEIKAQVDGTLTDKAEADQMLAENTARADLSVMDEARAYQARVDRYGETVEQIATIAGVAEFRVRWRLSLLTLIPECQSAVEANVLPAGPALEVAKLAPNQQMIGLSMWLKNPDMGALRFKELCQRLAATAAEPENLTLGGIDWEAEAAKATPKKHAHVDLIIRLATALVDCGYTGPLLHEASVASGATLTSSDQPSPGGTQ